MRIVVSGFPGTGKTTLVQALSDKYKLPIIKENMIKIGETNRKLNLALKSKNETQIKKLFDFYIKNFIEWDEHRAQIYKNNQIFIADRWEADLIDYWFLTAKSIVSGSDSITLRLFKSFKEKSLGIDFVIVTPLLKPFSGDINEEGNLRTKSFTSHIRSISTIVGLVKSFTNIPLILLPEIPMSVNDRVEYIDNFIIDYQNNN